MKVINLTDFPTPTLEKYQMLNQVLSVGGQMLEPGEVADVPADMEPVVRAELEHFLAIGAVAIDTPPADYRQRAPGSPQPPGEARGPVVPEPLPPPEPMGLPLIGPGMRAPDAAPSEPEPPVVEPKKSSRKKE